jgi:hypothetical protein
MKTALTYGAAMAVANALLTLVLYLLGLHDSAEKLRLAQWVGGLAGAGVGIAVLTLAIREKRAAFPADETWGYGNALGIALLTGVVGTFLGSVFGYIYFAAINPGMADAIYQGQVAAMEARGMSAAQIERAEPMMRKWMSAPILTLIQLFFGLVWSTLLALVVAAFLRRRPAAAADAPPPLA